MTVSCRGYTCNGSACRTSCTSNLDCLSTHYCNGTSCELKLDDGVACTMSSQCVGGLCAAFYADIDNDGFGSGTAQNRCSSGSAPTGFASAPGDCCNVDPDAFPGQTMYSNKPTSCRDYDYNCNGSDDHQFGLYSCVTFNCRSGWVTSIPACGAQGTLRTCSGLTCSYLTSTPDAPCR